MQGRIQAACSFMLACFMDCTIGCSPTSSRAVRAKEEVWIKPMALKYPLSVSLCTLQVELGRGRCLDRIEHLVQARPSRRVFCAAKSEPWCNPTAQGRSGPLLQ